MNDYTPQQRIMWIGLAVIVALFTQGFFSSSTHQRVHSRSRTDMRQPVGHVRQGDSQQIKPRIQLVAQDGQKLIDSITVG